MHGTLSLTLAERGPCGSVDSSVVGSLFFAQKVSGGLTRHASRPAGDDLPRSPHTLEAIGYPIVQLRLRRPLADVALATGFADQAHLTRKFKAAFGITPARYRALGASRPR